MYLSFEEDSELELIRGKRLYPHLEVGDLIMVRRTDWLSRFWSFFMNKYRHAAVYVGGGKVIEAQGFRTVGYQSLSGYEGVHDVFRYRDPLSSAQKSLLLYALQSRMSIKPDYADVLKQMFRYFFRFKLTRGQMHRYICSAIIRDAYQSAKLRVPEGDVSPEALAGWYLFKRVV